MNRQRLDEALQLEKIACKRSVGLQPYRWKIFAFPQHFLYNKHSFCHSAIVLKRQEEDYDLKYCFMDQ